MKYQESDLHISFKPNWRLRRFDTSRYFKLLSGLGLKGVDFIAIDEADTLYLIEVKNYKKRKKSPVAPDVSDLIGKDPPLQYHFVEKIQDSCQLIEVIHKYRKRKWWYRKLFRFKSMIPEKYANSDWRFWYDAFQILNHQPHRVDCILLLEVEATYPDIGKQHLIALPEKLLAYAKSSLKGGYGQIEIYNFSQWELKYSAKI